MRDLTLEDGRKVAWNDPVPERVRNSLVTLPHGRHSPLEKSPLPQVCSARAARWNLGMQAGGRQGESGPIEKIVTTKTRAAVRCCRSQASEPS